MFFARSSQDSVKPMVLVSMDGWGIAPASRGNAIYLAKPKVYNRLLLNFPNGQLIASGESVGLPANEVGNSEVGHLTMGVGRTIFQSLERINFAITEETFYKIPEFLNAITRVKAQGSTLHLVGLVGSGNVHSSYRHLEALLELCKRTKCINLLLHVITDGRDSPPQEGKEIIKDLQQRLLKEFGVGRIASVQGRYYAMDRDGRWERIKLGYEAIVMGKGKTVETPEAAFQETYGAGKSDEFVPPTVIVPAGSQPQMMNPKDEVIFFNFRVDRARELTMALTLPDFEHADTKAYGFKPEQSGFSAGEQATNSTFHREYWPSGLKVTTMTQYQAGLPVAGVAFPPQDKINNSVSEVVAKSGLKQLKLAESEKERMVTYYFDGMQDPFPNEEVVIVSSPKVATYDLKPEMAAMDIVKKFKGAVRQNVYRFIMINFANPDMVAHTGNLEATVRAIQTTDRALGEIVGETLKYNGTVVISADHGNSEELITYPNSGFYFTTSTGTVNTDHSNNPIPFIVVNKAGEGKPIKIPNGVMSDIAPTLLTLMGLPVPPEMTGKNLLAH